MTEHKTSDPGRVIRTAPFRTVSGDYFAVLLSEWIPRYGWTVLIPVLATAGYGCLSHDERWLLVALMLVFIVAPMVMSFLYTYYMLAPEARRTILCKTVEIYPSSHISLRYVAPEEETPAGDDKKIPADDSNDNFVLPPSETIPWSDVVRVRNTSRFQVYFLRGERMQFLLVPHSAVMLNRPPQCE